MRFRNETDLNFQLTRASLMNKVLPTQSAWGSFTLTVNGNRFSRKARKFSWSCSPDLVTGTRFPANSTYCVFPSNTCGGKIRPLFSYKY